MPTATQTQNLLTFGEQLSLVQQEYFSPVAVAMSEPTIPLRLPYCFLATVDPWPVDTSPPAPTQDTYSLKKLWKNIFAVKKITTNDINPVIERVDWAANTVFFAYDDHVDMFQRNPDGSLINHFYVKNKYDQVFKCLSNNKGALSTSEPFFEPGTYSTNNIYQGPDGYKWKYSFTIDAGRKIKFMDTNWLPVSPSDAFPDPLNQPAGIGSIDVINVVNGGSGYDPTNSVISIVVTGDGTGVVASPVIANGVITDIIVTNPGTNFTYANASVVSSTGSGAVLKAPVSPVGGHGFDPALELGCFNAMYSVEFTDGEGGVVPTDVTYHQVGLLVNPTDKLNEPNPANGAIYKTSTDLTVSSGFGAFVSGETIYQGASLNTATFMATVLDFNLATNVLSLINITGQPTTNALVFGNTSGTARTILTISTPSFNLFSGYITFVENRPGVQRSASGIEQFRFVLQF